MELLLSLFVTLILLLIDSTIELAFITSMVGYLHRSGANQYSFRVSNTLENYTINAKPEGLLVNQGHTSNGAAGTALVLICCGGFLVLWHQRRRAQKGANQAPSRIFLAYTIFTILSFLLTFAALIYTFVVTNQTKGQAIDLAVAAQFQNEAYPLDQWTPENWTKALLAMPPVFERDIAYLQHWLRIMQGWRWNLIPMLLIGLVVASLSVMTCLKERGMVRSSSAASGEKFMFKGDGQSK